MFKRVMVLQNWCSIRKLCKVQVIIKVLEVFGHEGLSGIIMLTELAAVQTGYCNSVGIYL